MGRRKQTRSILDQPDRMVLVVCRKCDVEIEVIVIPRVDGRGDFKIESYCNNCLAEMVAK